MVRQDWIDPINPMILVPRNHFTFAEQEAKTKQQTVARETCGLY